MRKISLTLYGALALTLGISLAPTPSIGAEFAFPGPPAFP